MIIALGESIVAIGVGVSGLPISVPVLAAAAAGVMVVAGLWRLYFRQISERAEHRLTALRTDGRTSAVLAIGGLGCLCAGAVVVLIPALLALGLLAAGLTGGAVLYSRRADGIRRTPA